MLRILDPTPTGVARESLDCADEGFDETCVGEQKGNDQSVEFRFTVA